MDLATFVIGIILLFGASLVVRYLANQKKYGSCINCAGRGGCPGCQPRSKISKTLYR